MLARSVSKINPNRSLNAIQTKLEIGKPNDKYEQEADAVADQVVSGGNAVQMKDEKKPGMQMMAEEEEGKMQMMPEEEEKSKLQMMPEEEEGKMQMMPEEEEGKMQMKPAVQRSADGTMHASADVSQRIQGSKGGGQSLPRDVQSELGQKMGADFSNVKVHTDSTAIQMNREVGAKAFTHSNHIYFNEGNYNPNSTEGKRLLAHELTHTMQQGAAGEMIQKTDDIRAVSVTVGGASIGTATVRSYPTDDGHTYEVPLYNMTVSGTNDAGTAVSQSWSVIRFGVQYDEARGVGPRVVGLADEQTHTLNWVDYMGGSWQVYGNFLIHDGPDNPDGTRWGAIGCVEVCGANGWENFNTLIKDLSNSDSESAISSAGQLTVSYAAATRPALTRR